MMVIYLEAMLFTWICSLSLKDAVCFWIRTTELAWKLTNYCFHVDKWYSRPQLQAAYWCVFSGPEEQLCRRLKPPIHPPGILIIWLYWDAKELHCLTPFKQRYCTKRVWLSCSLQCQRNKSVCVVWVCALVCLCCVCCHRARVFRVIIWICLFVHVSIPGHVCISLRFSLVVTTMQRGKCSPNVTPFSDMATCRAAHGRCKLPPRRGIK